MTDTTPAAFIAAERFEQALQTANSHFHAARFDACLTTCQQIIAAYEHHPDALLRVGELLLSFGFLSAARACFKDACQRSPADVRPVVNLANLAREAGDHAECRRLTTALLAHLPDHPVIRRNALASLEYDAAVSAAERLAHATAWGEWAVAKAGGLRARPDLSALESEASSQGRPLRVGYISADFCQHTVGLFVKDVLAAHRPENVQAFAYHAGRGNDWVTSAIRTACSWRDAAALDDIALAALIRADAIDVLVDLSGHTGGSRLTVFAHRAAPVQVSWLGYFATTGLAVTDAVLLDEWHAPAGTEAQFVEPIVRLPGGRFCYVPVPFAPPLVAPLPCLANGYITFGCFNNTAKLNAGVYALWAKLLHAVPTARLVLKWRTFHDAALCQSVRAIFAAHGIAPERIDLRVASFHADMLTEYADIDIALDPFPFSGGLTSCEALWSGVPVVTWPQSQVVSRQTFAFLSAIGLPELAAQGPDGADEYLRIAVALAEDRPRLQALREGLRERMRRSRLCDVTAFTRTLEQTLLSLAQKFVVRSL
ncbi:glycosyltransferase [Glaciimonas sp. PAMC28666]|uniref:O-linked N-acetylglucosamine transferase, SPINDLY family protein n=1 Tax=Glaciimonas sp. PAMC28666 TaxID=2807626 RepID=UPI001964A7B4|nr:glycosyltransferase [Glaciimonas sp. PAMC28666]QRX84523.1 glycosyltransferase [Glaciimonas sp. PAMC28666]